MTRSPSKFAPFMVIEGGAHEWTVEEMRGICFPTVKVLPFVKLKKDHQPGWHPESFWSVEPHGRPSAQRKLGQSYARELLAAMHADRCASSVLSHVLFDVIEDERRRGKRSMVVTGFLYELARILMPEEQQEGRVGRGGSALSRGTSD